MSALTFSVAERGLTRPGAISEELLAELTDAAYRAVLRRGLAGNFLDTQLDIWAALRAVLETASEES